MENQDKFWAIVELFGHTVLAGEISKCEIGDFVQINVPEAKGVPAWSKMVNPKAIYAISPVTEEVARAKAETIKAMPVDQWDTEQLFRNRFNELVEEGKIKRLEEPVAEEDELEF
jgi:hypothetical protein